MALVHKEQAAPAAEPEGRGSNEALITLEIKRQMDKFHKIHRPRLALTYIFLSSGTESVDRFLALSMPTWSKESWTEYLNLI